MIDQLFGVLTKLPEVSEAPSSWGGARALVIDGREFLHARDDGLLDVRLTRKLIRALDEDDRLIFRRGSSDWVWIKADRPDDLHFVLGLARCALAANRRASPDT